MELQNNIRSILTTGQWFGSLNAAHQDAILAGSTLRGYQDRQTINREDTRGIGLCAVIEGQVGLVRHVLEDRQLLVHVAGPGFWFGELSTLSEHLPAVTSVSRGASQVLVLPVAEFNRICEEDPSFFRACAQLALKRYAMVTRLLAQSQWLPKEAYLRIRLADLVDLWRMDKDIDGPVDVAISQSDLASMVGTSRQTVNALLQRLETAGLIQVRFRKIRILDPHALRDGHPTTGL